METLITPVTEGQKKQVKRFAEDAVDRAIAKGLLGKDNIQQLIKNRDEFQAHIIAVIKELSVSNQFADKEVESSDECPKGYNVKGITEQVATLRQFFSELKAATFDEKITSRPLPPNAKGWFAIPRWEKLGSSYCKSLDKVLAAIKSQRTVYDYCECETGREYLRQHANMVFQKLGNKQKGHDLLIVPCRFGLHHRNRSPFLPRKTVKFGLGAFAVGCMLLTHPELEVHWRHLRTDFYGGMFAPGALGGFASTPVFRFREGLAEFGAGWCGFAYEYYASASAFLAQ